jgi:tocopherol O-methyltransferase
MSKDQRKVMTAGKRLPSRNWTELKSRIQRHYDIAAPLYRSLWGLHIHHGYWRDGMETKETAQEQLVEHLAAHAEIRRGDRILDVGCGFGGSAKFLAERFGATVVGINISAKQVEIAKTITAGCEPAPHFILADAEYPGIRTPFDVVWSIEAISHVPRKRDCLERLLELLVPNGRVAIVDWFRDDGLNLQHELRYIDPIVRQMLLPELVTPSFYADTLKELGCRILRVQDISAYVAKTWDVCLQLTDVPIIWEFARAHGSDFVSFLKGLTAMKEGFTSRAFQCAMLIAEKSRV